MNNHTPRPDIVCRFRSGPACGAFDADVRRAAADAGMCCAAWAITTGGQP